jgi:hypothetical protein
MTKKKIEPKKAKPKRVQKTETEIIAERRKKIESICLAYENGNVTIESCCGEFGITVRTFWNWADRDSWISERYKNAKEIHGKIGKESIREKAVDALTRLIIGYWVEETEIDELFSMTGQLTGKRVKTKKRYVGPHATAVIFALKNTDPTNWGDNFNVDIQGDKQIFKIGDQIIEFN